MWNGSSWTSSSTIPVVPGVTTTSNSNTLSIGSNLYHFYTLKADGKRYIVRRINNTWTSPILVSDFTTTDTSEIVDSDGNIHIFATDESLTDNTLKYRKYTVSTNSFTAWATLDSQTSSDVNHPSATISSNGNIWVYYNINTDIYYKILNKSTGTWGVRTNYTVENPTTWADLSGNNNNGTLTDFDYTSSSGWVGDGSGDNPYALRFDGMDDYIQTPSFSFSSNITFDIWLFSSSVVGNNIVASQSLYKDYGWYLWVNSNGSISLTYNEPGSVYSAGIYNGSVLDAWHHIVFTIDTDSQKVNAWVDGIRTYENIDMPITMASGERYLNLGNYYNGTEYIWKGSIASSRYYDRVLSESEINELNNLEKNSLTNYPIEGLLTDFNAAKVDGTNPPSGGPTLYPKVRYQENFHYSPDKIDLLYRQNPTGDISSYNLYYGTVGSDTTGVYTSPESGPNVLSSSWLGGWADPALTSNVNIPDGTAVKYELRTGNGADSSNITWGNWAEVGTVDSSTGTGNRLYQIAAASMPDNTVLPIGESKYLQARITLTSQNGTNVPTLYDYSINYLADETPPVWNYPASVPAFTDITKVTSVPHNSFAELNNLTSIYFDWSGATDGLDESGISNYYVYFGPDNTADPLTAGTDKGALTEGLLDILAPVSGIDYYLRVSVRDLAGNFLHMPQETSIFTYKFDNTAPYPPTNYSVSPVGWSTTNDFTFTWQAALDPGSGSSGIKGYEYKRATEADTWTFIAAAPSISIPNVTAYQDGMNDFYVRSIDNAGNNSGDTTEDFTVIHYYYNGSAPSKPTNLQVTPQTSESNSFTFTWGEPDTHNSDIRGYYYSVNTLPSVNNTVFTTGTTTGVIPAATQQGFNDFYVVAIDVNDNINWANYETARFECNTTAPGIPGGVVVSDSSNMAAEDWALTTKWLEPETGFVSLYFIYRSSDGENFTKIAETASTGYLDSGLANTSTYYYKITAVDNAGAESGFSSVVSKQPTGKFTEPPIIVSGPEVDAKATNATIIWSTNRPSTSFVAYGKSAENLESKGQLDEVTSHEVSLSGLEPGTTYYYKVQSFDENRDYSTDQALSTTYAFKTQPAPGIEEVEVSDISLSSAIVSWKTTSSATSKVIYGKDADFNQAVTDESGSQVTIHTVKLTELDHSTTYSFKIEGVDVDGNELASDNYNFQTLTYPRISNVRFEQQKNTATSTLKVTWESNVPLTSVIEYQKASGGSVKEISKSKLTTSHSLLVSGLLDNTDYLIRALGRDAYGNQALSDQNRVRTDYDTRPPAISAVTTETDITGYGLDSKGQLVVSWETDEPATSQVEYGIGSSGEYTSRTQEDTALTTSHVVIISELKTSSPYHFRILSSDAASNQGVSNEYSALTPQASRSVFDAILSALEGAIGW